MVNTMNISGLSDSGMIAMAQTLNASKVQENVGAAVLKMANDQAKQEGQDALQLIASSTPSGPLGHHLDVMA